MNLVKALEIPGWTNNDELLWLAKRASEREQIVEIGSWQGRSAVAMATNTVGTVHCVDTFVGTSPEEHGTYFAGKPADYIYSQFVANTSHLDNVKTYRSQSLLQAAKFKDLGVRFDMIFIDADHSYEAVKADIIAWLPLLKPGGLFCGHDWDSGRPGVVRAVKELLARHKRVGAGSLWMVDPAKY